MNGNVQVLDFSKEEGVKAYNFYCNASWVTVRDKDKKKVFDRSCLPGRKDWYDAKHLRIVKAMAELEAAVLAAIE